MNRDADVIFKVKKYSSKTVPIIKNAFNKLKSYGDKATVGSILDALDRDTIDILTRFKRDNLLKKRIEEVFIDEKKSNYRL